MNIFIRAAARSPFVTAIIVKVALKLHVIDGRELALLFAATNTTRT
jgi:hypothetical protein